MLGPFGLHPKGTMRARALPAARALAARGHVVRVIMPPWHTPQEAGRTWTDGDVAIEYVSLDRLRAPVLGHLLVARRMASAALAHQPDVVHAFKPKAYSGLAAVMVRARQRLGARLALVTDTDDWEGPGGWNELEPYGRWMRSFFAWQERWGLPHADAVTVASRALESLAWSLGVPAGRVTYVPNALSAVEQTPLVAAPAQSRPPTVLLYTRFFEFDIARPLAVLAEVKRRVPDVRLVVVGRGLFGEEKDFLRAAQERGLDDAVDYRGWLEPNAASAVFAQCDVAMYPFDDTLVNRTKSPVKLLELMAAGVVVVAEAVGEPAQMVVDGTSGRLVPSGNTVAFAEAVHELLEDATRRHCMAQAARRRVRDLYCWDTRSADLERVYASAVAGR